MDDPWITSVGIDIGTSTTKMIISRLKLARTSSHLNLPRYDIIERELVYQSPIFKTPLLSRDEIDAEQIWRMLAREYELAGVVPSTLKSGAVIITGETATKKNARQILHLLAERSGDFVVATAGADLEGLLAAKGAGAVQRSLQLKKAVANIDVGGGTANTAIFQRGKPIGTVTFHVGGSLIQLDRSGTIQAISPSLRPWLLKSGFSLEVGQLISMELLMEICGGMSRDMLDYLAGYADVEHRPAIRELMVDKPLAAMPPIEEWTFSGGIGLMMNGPPPQSMEETTVHSDIGPLLANTIKTSSAHYPIRLGKPEQTVRATVIGAGMQSTEISGATVHLDASLLPIRNLPVLKLMLTPTVLEQQRLLSDAVSQAMQMAANLYDREASPPFALALSGTSGCTYAVLQRISQALAEQYRIHFSQSPIMVVISDNDIAQALGQSLEKRFGGLPKIICVDQIKVEHGDYVDLGEPIAGIMIPVVVKTLAFHN